MPTDPTTGSEPNPDFDALVNRLRQLDEDRPSSESAITKPEYHITKHKPTGHTIRIWSTTDESWQEVDVLHLGWN